MTERHPGGHRPPFDGEPLEMEVVVHVRRDATGKTSARLLAADGALDFGVASLEDLPLLLEALLTDSAPH